jgi:NitT/TauT family transport system substrate-binding protein
MRTSTSHISSEPALADYAPLPLVANDAATGQPISDAQRVAQIWLTDEGPVRHYASPESALKALIEFEKPGRPARAVYAQDRNGGIKLLDNQAWFVRRREGRLLSVVHRA